MTTKGKTVYVLAVSQNDMQITTVTRSELQGIGYKWKALTDCAASLQRTTCADILQLEGASISASGVVWSLQ